MKNKIEFTLNASRKPDEEINKIVAEFIAEHFKAICPEGQKEYPFGAKVEITYLEKETEPILIGDVKLREMLAYCKASNDCLDCPFGITVCENLPIQWDLDEYMGEAQVEEEE